jgi:hypothetical protein
MKDEVNPASYTHSITLEDIISGSPINENVI